MYFDAEKAEFQLRLENLRKERDAKDNGAYIPHNFKGAFSKKFNRSTNYIKSVQRYNLRLLFFLSALLIFSYFLFQTHMIDQFIKQFLDVFSKKNGLY